MREKRAPDACQRERPEAPAKSEMRRGYFESMYIWQPPSIALGMKPVVLAET